MPKRKKAANMPWFKKSSKKRRRKSYLGAPRIGGGRVGKLVTEGAATVAGAALGSMVGARVPLPAQMAGFRGLVPVVAGIGLGMTKFGRAGLGANLALGMVVAGGLAVGRQFAPQLFAGEDEMLGLPELDEPLGLVYAGQDEDLDGEEYDEMQGEDVLGAVYQSGEDPEDVELFGEFATPADM